MNAILLARVSTDEQIDALPAQTQRLVNYAKDRGYKYRLIEFQESAYKDEGRRKFAEIVEVIQSYSDTVVVVFDKIDRYSRELSSEQTKVFQKLLNSGKIEMHLPSDNLFVHKNSPAADLFRLGIGIVLAKYYSDAISDNVKRRLEQKLRDGEWIGQAPIGYKNTVRPDGKKWVDISPYEAEAVKSMYEWYSTGSFSFRLVRRKLKDEFAIVMSNSQLDKVLMNPFYYGEMKVKGELYPHRYKQIIDKELFDEAQAVRHGYKKKPFKYAGLPFYYRGLVRCSDCDCSLTPEKKKQKYVYYHCSQFKTHTSRRFKCMKKPCKLSTTNLSAIKPELKESTKII
jgi:site-specific DNA recombinase